MSLVHIVLGQLQLVLPILPNRGVRRGLREIARPASSAQYIKPVRWSHPNDRAA